MAVQRTTLRLTMLLLGFPRGGMVVDRLLEALARDAVVGLSAPHHPPPSLMLKIFFYCRSIGIMFPMTDDRHFQGEMRRGDGATELSGATIADYSQLQDDTN